MLTPAELAEARELQEALMVDQLLVERQTGTLEGEISATPIWATVYDKKGRLQAEKNRPAIVDVGGRPVRPTTYVGAIPWDAPRLEPGDRVTVTSTANPNGVAAHYVIRTVEQGSTLVTCRRFTAEEGVI